MRDVEGNRAVGDPDRPVRRGPAWLRELTANPLAVSALAVCIGVFSVARLTDPENVRFLAFDSAEWPDRWWGIVTYGFVHVEWNHIIVNMLILIWVGVWVERLIGSARFTVLVLVLVLTAIVAGGVTLLVRDTAGIGFSAAAAGVLTYYHFAFPWKRELPLRIPNVVLPVVLIVGSVAAIVLGWFGSVGNYPHLAGGAIGVVALVAFHRHHRPLDDDRPRPVVDQQLSDR